MISERPNDSDVFGGGGPPRRPGRKVDIYSVKPGCELRVILTGRAVETCWTHWLGDGSSKPCLNHRGCPWCQKNLSRRWKAYVSAFCPATKAQCIVELTAHAVETCPALMDPTKDLRGKALVLIRANSARNAPVLARIETANATEQRLYTPACTFDLREQLFKIWRFDPSELARERGEEEPTAERWGEDQE